MNNGFYNFSKPGQISAKSASYALTASYALNGGGGGGNINTSSFATTGSNQFSGSQYITGSLSISNNITASYFVGNGSLLTGIFLEKRHDVSGSYSYCGTAPSGSSEAANVWNIDRITIYSTGSVLIQSASSVSWTGRYNHIYN